MIPVRKATLDIEALKDPKRLVSEYEEVLEGLLGEYLEGGAPTVFGLHVEEVDYDEKSNKGYFHVEYMISYYYGCDDMNKDVEADGPISFVVDEENYEVVFSGWDQPEREPDEY